MSNSKTTRSDSSRRPVSGTGGGSARRRPVRGSASASRRPQPAPAGPESWKHRARRFLPSASAPLVVLALAVVAVCLAVILIGGWRMAYLPAAIGQTWLSLHGVGLRLDGVELGAVPLLPAMGIVAVVASRIRAATRERVSVLDLACILALTVLTSLLLSAIALFMVADAANVFSIAPPPVASALLIPLGVHLIGFVLGIRAVIWRALAKRAGVPVAAVDTLLDSAAFFRDLAYASLAVFVVLLLLGHARVAEAMSAYPNLGFFGEGGLALLCLAYLPNAVVATLAVLLGGSFEYAGASVSLFDVTAAPLPPLPVFAAIPTSAPSWAPVLMLVPAALAVRFAASRSSSLIDAAACATWSALLGLIAGAFASGTAGAYGVVGPNPWTLALAMFVWVGVTSFCAWLIALVRGRLRPAAGKEPADRPDPVGERPEPAAAPAGPTTETSAARSQSAADAEAAQKHAAPEAADTDAEAATGAETEAATGAETEFATGVGEEHAAPEDPPEDGSKAD